MYRHLAFWMACSCAAALGQSTYPTKFDPKIASRPTVAAALKAVDGRKAELTDSWIKLTEIPAVSGKEGERAKYVIARLKAMGFPSPRVDEMGNVIAERPGTDPNGPVVVFAAHMDTVFGLDVPRKVRREGGRLYCPGIGDDSSGLIGQIEAFRALQEANVKTRGKLVFVATVQEETRLRGARYFLEKSGIKTDMFVAVDISLGEIWYGALRIARLRLAFTSAGSHTLYSRDLPTPVKAVGAAIQGIYGIQLPPVTEGLGDMKVPVVNVGMMGAGTVYNAIPQEAWFTVDLRSLDNATQDRLESQVVQVAREAARKEGVGFEVTKPQGEDVDFSKAKAKEERRAHPIVQTALDVTNFLGVGVNGNAIDMDMGSTDANVAVGMGIPAIAVGAVRAKGFHTLTESAEEDSLPGGVKMLVLLAATLAEAQ